jgi:hypothetical protein
VRFDWVSSATSREEEEGSAILPWAISIERFSDHFRLVTRKKVLSSSHRTDLERLGRLIGVLFIVNLSEKAHGLFRSHWWN